MDNISIVLQMAEKDYINLSFSLFYRKPVAIFCSFAGLVMFVLSSLYFLGLYDVEVSTPLLPFVGGFFMSIGLPFVIFKESKKNFQSHARLKEQIIYEFDSEKIKIAGESFLSELSWPQTYKVVELKNWMLIYENKLVMNAIPK